MRGLLQHWSPTQPTYRGHSQLPSWRHRIPLAACLLLICISCTESKATQKLSYQVPHSARPGYIILTIPQQQGQRSWLMNSDLFSLDLLGQLTTREDLSSLVDKKFSLEVRHFLSGAQPWSDILDVHVVDGEHVGQFFQQPYIGQITENTPAGTTVQGLQSLFDDLQRFPYGCIFSVSGSDGVFFDFSSLTGSEPTISTTMSLDREFRSLLYLAIQSECSSSHIARARVTVKVLDVNDNPPKFGKDRYQASVDFQAAKAGQPILKVTATDRDDQDTVQYTLDPAFTSLFSIDTESGYILAGDQLPSVPKTYEFSVNASDLAGHMTPPVTIQIKVTTSALSHRHKRQTSDRAEKVIVVPMYSTNELMDVSDGPGERFRFSDPAPEGLDISLFTGVISRRFGAQWTPGERNFVVNVTRDNDPNYQEDQPVRMYIVDRAWDAPILTSPTPWVAIPEWIRPDTVIMTVTGVDTLPPYGAPVIYRIESGSADCFTIDPVSGAVMIACRQQFPLDDHYSLAISAESPYGVFGTATPVQVVTVYVGQGALGPRFADEQFVIGMSENTNNGEVFYRLQAVSFKELPLTYSFVPMAGSFPRSTFELDSRTGDLRLVRRLVHIRDRHQYRFMVRVMEDATDATATAEVIVNLVGENLNNPFFPAVVYVVKGVEETRAIGSRITSITAIDKDLGLNGQLVFDVSDDHFGVTTSDGKTADININRALDYDYLPLHKYEFELVARDAGSPSLSATTMVQVWVDNSFDEAPVMDPPVQVVRVKEDAPPRTTRIHFVQAYDPDGQSLTFSFISVPFTGSQPMFQMNSETGEITLMAAINPGSANMDLGVRVSDGGQVTTGTVRVEFVGVNHPPVFSDCGSYFEGTVVEEGKEIGTFIREIVAEDEDSGENGRLSFRVIYDAAVEDELFQIGEVDRDGFESRADLISAVQFDRENPERAVFDQSEKQRYKVTVLAEDNGSPKLAASCFFFVEIQDVNDQQPQFDTTTYNAIIMNNIARGTSVIRVFAVDGDLGQNGRVTYEISRPALNCPSCFTIDPQTGLITRDVGTLPGTDSVMTLRVRAQDNGANPQVSQEHEVSITVTDNIADLPPRWSPYNGRILDEVTTLEVMENATSGTQFLQLQSTSEALLSVREGRTAMENSLRNFRRGEFTDNTMWLETFDLDYQLVPRYSVRVRAAPKQTSSNYFSDARLTVNIIDVNNEEPVFVGLNEKGAYPATVTEKTVSGDMVVNVTAIDDDGTSPNNLVRYRFAESCNGDCDAFSIDERSGVIRAARQAYRPEEQAEYFLAVEAFDGAPSAIRTYDGKPNSVINTVTVRVSGISQNSPYFSQPLYRADIPEGVAFNTTVTTVSAVQPDNNVLQYLIVGGNEERKFACDSMSGRIYTSGELVARVKDLYTLDFGVFDGVKTNRTTVSISVLRRDIYPPDFSPTDYEVGTVRENDNSISPANPRILTTVSAEDPSGEPVSFTLEGHYYEQNPDKFDILPSGEVRLMGPLDRDEPEGTDDWLLNVVADDGRADSPKGYGMLHIRPQDEDDNGPTFDSCCLVGNIPEGSGIGYTALQLEANDPDSGPNADVLFAAVDMPRGENGQELFRVTPSGAIVSQTPALDRETRDRYQAIVRVFDPLDQNKSENQTIDIVVGDINDNRPTFEPRAYIFEVDEEIPPGGAVGAVFATDADIGENARLTYSIESGGAGLFVMDSLYNAESGVIRVAQGQRLDFESLTTREYRLTVRVSDPNPANTATANVVIQLRDINDNAPEFITPPAVFNVTEGEEDPNLPRFFATDADSGENADIDYSIAYEHSDPDRRFVINPNGQLMLRLPLDREAVPMYRLEILATDHGDPALTGTTTLTVYVGDRDDTAPDITGLSPDFPVVTADTRTGDEVVRLDLGDEDGDGGAGGVTVDCNANYPDCADFSITQPQPGGRPEAVIRANKNGYTRKDLGRSSYNLPLTLQDSNGNSRTRQVRIYVESKNDNVGAPGSSQILVYNYKGELPDTEIGRVYCDDADDWDLPDKTFSPSGGAPANFGVNAETGAITMLRGTPRGDHTLSVNVFDKAYQTTIMCTVTVTVMYIYDDAVLSSGSIRLSGTTAEEFISRSEDPMTGEFQDGKYQLLQKTLARLLGTEVDFVEIFNVQDVPDTTPDTIDVYYAAHGSPYYRSARLNGVVFQNREAIRNDLGLTVIMAPINHCLDDTQCYGAGCSNQLEVSPEGTVVRTNLTTFVGVTSSVVPACVCADREFSDVMPPTCGPYSCRNNGTCVEDYAGFTCECEEGFSGPQCQQTKLSFSGQGWAWFDPLTACEDIVISLEFMTTQTTGLLLYNGPLGAPVPTSDYLSLHLQDGYPVVRVNVGGGVDIVMEIDGMDSNGDRHVEPLNDGEWHHLEIFKQGREYRVVVDYCQASTVVEDISSSREDRRACERREVSNNVLTQINVLAPLSLGGRPQGQNKFPPQLSAVPGYNGCVKNLRINGKLIDLHVGEVTEAQNTEEGCPRESCAACPIGTECISGFSSTPLCVCPPGFRGNRCDQAMTVRDFHASQPSYVEWALKPTFNASQNFKTSELQLMFRTRQLDGVIFSADSFSTLERIVLQVSGGRLGLRYDLGSGDSVLDLPAVNVSDGRWHTAMVRRYGTQVNLMLDGGGDGRTYAEAWPRDAHRLLALANDRLYAGAKVKYNFWSQRADVTERLSESCVKDVRYNTKWFPMTREESTASPAAQFIREVATDTECSSAACGAGIVCPFGSCVDVWRNPWCSCPYGLVPDDGLTCVPIMDCSIPRCVYGDCVLVPPRGAMEPLSWRCNCWDGWYGNHCNQTEPVVEPVVANVNSGLIAAVVVCIIVLLLIILLVVCLTRRRNKDYLLDDPEEDIRETCRHYDEEGAGEEDTHGYDLSRLPKPVVGPGGGRDGPYRPGEDPDTPHRRYDEPPIAEPEMMHPTRSRPQFASPSDYPNVQDFIADRLADSDRDPNAPPYDSVREYEYEGGGSTAGSLSSLQSSSSGDQDWDYLQDLGPPFRKLADMYSGGGGADD